MAKSMAVKFELEIPLVFGKLVFYLWASKCLEMHAHPIIQP